MRNIRLIFSLSFFLFTDSNCDFPVNRKRSRSKVAGTWRTVKFDTLRVKPVKKLSRFNEIIDGVPHRHLKFRH